MGSGDQRVISHLYTNAQNWALEKYPCRPTSSPSSYVLMLDPQAPQQARAGSLPQPRGFQVSQRRSVRVRLCPGPLGFSPALVTFPRTLSGKALVAPEGMAGCTFGLPLVMAKISPGPELHCNPGSGAARCRTVRPPGVHGQAAGQVCRGRALQMREGEWSTGRQAINSPGSVSSKRPGV